MSATAPFAGKIAQDIAAGRLRASELISQTLSRIRQLDSSVNAFTHIATERATETAGRIDRRRAAGETLGPLAGVPFAVKNLVDIQNVPTLAGSKINQERTPAAMDAEVVQRLEAAGAILIGALNMGEYAYDFTGENAHYGPSRNPHDLERMTGGSSGGSAAAVAAGLVPLSVGSDTNGSIRVPSAFCGVFGLKPTFGRITRAGTFPFVSSLDHLGPFARTVTDLALAYDAMQGSDSNDPAADDSPIDLVTEDLRRGAEDLRIGQAVGYFAQGADRDAIKAVQIVSNALGVQRKVEIPEPARARAAAQIITASGGASLHMERLRSRAKDFDPVIRDRLFAGATVPAIWVENAQRFRRWYCDQLARLFESVDVILAPTTPCRAPKIGETMIDIEGERVALRPAIGVFTQPISLAGFPVVAVPIWIDDGLPLGLQIISSPWREDLALRVAFELEQRGIARAPIPAL